MEEGRVRHFVRTPGADRRIVRAVLSMSGNAQNQFILMRMVCWPPGLFLRRRFFAQFVDKSTDMLRQLGRKKFHGNRFRISAHHFIGGWDAGRFRVHGISPNLNSIIRLRIWLLPEPSATFTQLLLKNDRLSGPAGSGLHSLPGLSLAQPSRALAISCMVSDLLATRNTKQPVAGFLCGVGACSVGKAAAICA